MKFCMKPVKCQHNKVLHETSEVNVSTVRFCMKPVKCQHNKAVHETSEMSTQLSSAQNQSNGRTTKCCVKRLTSEMSAQQSFVYIALVCETVEPSFLAHLTHKSVLTSAAAVLRHSTVLGNVDPQLSSSVV